MNKQGTIEQEFFFENNPQGIEHLTTLLTSDDQVVMESVRPDRVQCEAM
jgi:primosomal replication protein N